MTMAYGTEQAYASNQVYFRTFTDANITSSTDTAATISVTSGIQYKDSRGLIGSCSRIVYQALYKTVGSNETTMSERSNTNIYVETQVESVWTTIGEYSKTATTSVTKTHSAQSLKFRTEMMIITAAYGAVPAEQAMGTGYVTITVPAKTSYTVAYNANGGSGAPSSQTKWYGEALGLSSDEPTRAGYLFKNWNTASDGSGATYNPGASYTANAQLTLYAQWEPSLEMTSIDVVRCDSSGSPDAIGSYVKAVVAWETDSTISGSALALACSSPSASATEELSGSSGTTTVGPIGGSFRADTTYSFTVSLTDSLSNTISETVVSTASSTGYTAPVVSTVSAIRSDSLGSPDDSGEYCFVTFSWAIAAIGSQTAPSSCEVKSYEYGTQTALVTQSVTLTGTSGTNSLLVGADVYSPDKQYMVEVTLADALNTATKSDIMSTGYFTMDVLAGGRGVAFGKPSTLVDVLDVGYDIHSDGRVETRGTVVINQRVIDRDAENPTEDQWGSLFQINDKDGEPISSLQPSRMTDGRVATYITTYNEKSDGTQVQNALSLFVAKDGTRTYGVSDAANFRSAIDAAASSHSHTISQVSWPQAQNLTCSSNANNQEWSVDLNAGSYTGCYWHVWSGKNSKSILSCYNDNCNVAITNGRLEVRHYGTSYIAGLTNPAIYQSHPSSNSWSPIIAWRTKSQGGWSLGSYDNDNAVFAFGTAANISSNTNTTVGVTLRPTAGTIALTSEVSARVPKPDVLYNNTSGANGGITLSKSAANYNHMRIHYRNNSGSSGHVHQYSDTEVFAPNGKYASLHCVGPDTLSQVGLNLNGRLAYINGTSINNARSASGSISSTGASAGIYNEIFIVRVEAWND